MKRAPKMVANRFITGGSAQSQ